MKVGESNAYSAIGRTAVVALLQEVNVPFWAVIPARSMVGIGRKQKVTMVPGEPRIFTQPPRPVARLSVRYRPSPAATALGHAVRKTDNLLQNQAASDSRKTVGERAIRPPLPKYTHLAASAAEHSAQ